MKTKFYIVVLLHHLLAIGLVLAPIFSLVLQPWYITLIVTTFVVRTATSRDTCILTNMEIDLREKLGMPSLSNGFVGHYYLNLYKRIVKKV